MRKNTIVSNTKAARDVVKTPARKRFMLDISFIVTIIHYFWIIAKVVFCTLTTQLSKTEMIKNSPSQKQQ